MKTTPQRETYRQRLDRLQQERCLRREQLAREGPGFFEQWGAILGICGISKGTIVLFLVLFAVTVIAGIIIECF